MEIIKCLEDFIHEEIEDAHKYIAKGLKIREEFPEVADLMNILSNEEMKHMQMLHNMVVKIIENYRATKGEPPEPMMAVYNYLHEKAIEKSTEVRILQQMYMDK